MNQPTTKLTDKYESALIFANRLHQKQIRRINRTPYFAHLLSVSALVLEDGGTEEEAIAALLHDAIEDQGGKKTGDIIRDKFGNEIADIVEGCTEESILPKPSWRERKQKYIDNLRHSSPEICRVALADKLHNTISNIEEYYQHGIDIWQNFGEGKKGLVWFYSSVIEAVRDTKYSGLLMDKLARAVSQLEQLPE